MLSWEESVGLALGFLSALSRPQQGGGGGGEAGGVSGMDSIPLHCLGIYSSHMGDPAEQEQMCNCLEDRDSNAWETCCVHLNVLYVCYDLPD